MSIVLFLLTFWTLGYSGFAAGWTESVAYYGFTYYILDKFAKPKTFGVSYVLAIIMGRIVLELPIRIIEFSDTLGSLIIIINVLVSILLAALYFREKRTSLLVLSFVILTLLNTVVVYKWVYEF